MDPSILAVLELVREALPVGLIDREGYVRLAAIAEQLPEELTTFWGFESRLGETAARADILFETRRESRGQSLLAGTSRSALDELCRRWETWQMLREFARLCQDKNHVFAAGIRNLWLEFDVAGTLSTEETTALIRQPSVFIGPDSKALSRDAMLRLILDASGVFQSNGWHAGLEAFVRRLPEGAELFQAGFMLARKSPGLRICVSKIPAQEIPGWLCQTGWSGDPEALARLLRLVSARSQTLALNLNLTADGPSEKVGVECYMDWLVDDAQQWAPLLDWLEQQHLCLPQKRRGLEEFPGMTRSPRLPNGNDRSVLYLNLYRKIHHIKLSITGGRVAEAKGYFALSRPALLLDLSAADSRDAWLNE